MRRRARRFEQVGSSPMLDAFYERYADAIGVSEPMEEILYRGGSYLTYFDDEVEALDYLRSNQALDYRTYDPDNLTSAQSRRITTSAMVAGTGMTSRAAPITDIPTTTSNPERPRTVAAGWESYADRREGSHDANVGVLTVVFRDGTYWNYYDMARGEWAAFERSRSKGWYIATYMDGKRHGAANVGAPARAVSEIIYRIARTAQLAYKGGTKQHQTPASYEVRKRLKQFNRYTSSSKRGRYLIDPGYGRKAGRYVTSSRPIRQGQPPNK